MHDHARVSVMFEGFMAHYPQVELLAGRRIPAGKGELLPWLLAMSQDDLVSLLALCVARTVDGVSGDEADDRARLLADAIALNMGA
jgi:hypothetical protein